MWDKLNFLIYFYSQGYIGALGHNPVRANEIGTPSAFPQKKTQHKSKNRKTETQNTFQKKIEQRFPCGWLAHISELDKILMNLYAKSIVFYLNSVYLCKLCLHKFGIG